MIKFKEFLNEGENVLEYERLINIALEKSKKSEIKLDVKFKKKSYEIFIDTKTEKLLHKLAAGKTIEWEGVSFNINNIDNIGWHFAGIVN